MLPPGDRPSVADRVVAYTARPLHKDTPGGIVAVLDVATVPPPGLGERITRVAAVGRGMVRFGVEADNSKLPPAAL